MRVLILAGGFGKRLWPVTKKTPKPMIQISARPVLGWIIDGLRKQGFNDIVVALYYLADQFIDLMHDKSIKYYIQQKDYGTAGAIKAASSLLRDDKYFMVVNGDTLTNLDYKNLLKTHKFYKSIATVFTHDDEIHCGGTYIFDRDIVDFIPEKTYYDIKNDLMPLLKKLNIPITLAFEDSYYLDIGTPDGLEKAKKAYANKGN